MTDQIFVPELLIAATSYCRPIGDLDELRGAAFRIRSRTVNDTAISEFEGESVAVEVDRHLDSALPGASGSLSEVDETGHCIMFLCVMTPLARERSRRLAALDRPANHEPLLITMLLPERAFNVIEIEATYGFNLRESISSQYGNDLANNIVVFRGAHYFTANAVFCSLAHEHPALLISLGYSAVFGANDRVSTEVREVLRTIDHGLQATEVALLDHLYDEDITTKPSEVYHAVVALFVEGSAHISALVSPEDLHDSRDNSSFVRHIMHETIESLITEERMIFDDIASRIASAMGAAEEEDANYDDTPTMIAGGSAFDLDYEMESGVDAIEDPLRVAILEGLHRLRRALRTAKRRLFRLRQAIPRPTSE